MASWLMLAAILAWVCVAPFAIYLYDPKRLRRYPNQNFLSGLTSLAYVYERTNSFRTKELRSQHDKYSILRTGPTGLSFGSVGAIKDISTGTGRLLITGSHPHILNVVDKDRHARKQRMLSHAFATRNLEQWEYKIADKVQQMVAQFDKHCTDPPSKDYRISPDDLIVNFRFWSNLFTLDAIADIALSEQLGLLESGTDLIKGQSRNAVQDLHLIDSLHCGGRTVSRFIGATGWFHFLKALTTLFSPHFRAHADDYGNIVSMLTEKRLDKHKSDNLSDLVGCLVEDKAGKTRGFDRGEIEAEASILLDAGSDTTAIALTNVLYYLIKHPISLQKLREEVAGALTEGETIAPYAKVKSLPYLKACLDESLRLSPPLPRGLERKTPPQGMEILGERIAGGITVSVSTYVAHRDPTLFPEPDSYMPERWLDDSEAMKDMRAAFIPFTTGARACIGRNITMMEQQILIATLVHRYDFALPTRDWNLTWEEAFNLWPSKMPLKLWRREVFKPQSG
ncbi:benzoate 4-monooxygenase cytochrome P450 [Penicillium hispanicum]|uniref:benzoate 4-monooxygenase cytochrome P450 n=1 Tax=Penicillium hispanicum TaxID=1080232 RepID=UPI00254159D3|nr:benzoate 4-monooxygenase cytochrome P450 [Penicillium hispanicum]KAJ5584429.1 benzoate 4-monooxygenase cytochrome P450 [Penicillium hispanicum]